MNELTPHRIAADARKARLADARVIVVREPMPDTAVPMRPDEDGVWFPQYFIGAFHNQPRPDATDRPMSVRLRRILGDPDTGRPWSPYEPY